MILIQPTGEMIENLPEMAVVPDSTTIYQLVDSAVENTFVGEAVKLYYLAEQYLYYQGELENIEPAYLAVTKNMGGFARQGFYLKNADGTVLDKSAVHYIDLTDGSISSPFEQLSSITQLYPHELMHAIFKMLSYQDSVEMTSYNVNMHYFSVITDYNTAFNEGFAEHMENVSLLFEPSEAIKKGKYQEIEKMKPRLEHKIDGFKRDYLWSLRLDYYKQTMLLWYQQYENYKRNVHAVSDQASFVNSSPDLESAGDMITIRNSGIEQDAAHKKNLVQRMASEGFVSTFFTHLAMSALPKLYQPAPFYNLFLSDTNMQINPEEYFSPLQNLFIKYFYVLHQYVDYQHSERAQLIDFIDGYMTAFPDEAYILRDIYRDLTGEEYGAQLPPPIWMMTRDYQHPVLVMDPYGATKVPLYTFDLNAADVPDLITIKGINRASASKIIEYRDKIGLFRSLEEIKDVQGLDKSEVEILLSSKVDEEYFKSIPEDNINITALIIKPLLHLLYNGLLLFIFIGLVVIGMYYKDGSIKNIVLQLVKKLSIWILFLLAGLASVILSGNPILMISGFVAIYLLMLLLIFRKKRQVFVKNLIISLLMAGLVLYSVI